jgi:hypothetical protein
VSQIKGILKETRYRQELRRIFALQPRLSTLICNTTIIDEETLGIVKSLTNAAALVEESTNH